VSRRVVEQCLASLWDAVEREVGPDRFRKEFAQWRVGDLGQGTDHAWAQTNDDARPRCDLPNLTIEINSHELSLNVVGDFDEQAGHVERWLVGASLSARLD
jgi:hypothetical protein